MPERNKDAADISHGDASLGITIITSIDEYKRLVFPSHLGPAITEPECEADDPTVQPTGLSEVNRVLNAIHDVQHARNREQAKVDAVVQEIVLLGVAQAAQIENLKIALAEKEADNHVLSERVDQLSNDIQALEHEISGFDRW